MKQERRGSAWLAWGGPERRMLRRIVIVTIGAFVLGYGVSALWMWAGASRRSVVTVPNLRELTVAEARRALDGSDLALEVGDSLPNSEVPEGRILTQSPLPGQEVAPASAVQVILSTGAVRHAVPQVADLSRDQAQQLLIGTGMEPVVEEVVDSRRAGRVVGTIPTAGSVVATPARVRLLISAGPPLVAVPSVVGLPEGEAAGILTAAGLRMGGVTRELTVTEVEGQVISQRPSAGDSIAAGSAVTLVVATQRPELLPPQEIP